MFAGQARGAVPTSPGCVDGMVFLAHAAMAINTGQWEGCYVSVARVRVRRIPDVSAECLMGFWLGYMPPKSEGL